MTVFGKYDEALPLVSRIAAMHNGAAWLAKFERKFKLSLVKQLHDCLLETLDRGKCYLPMYLDIRTDLCYSCCCTVILPVSFYVDS